MKQLGFILFTGCLGRLFRPALLALFLSICISETVTPISPEKLAFKHITEEDGLTNSYIYSICQDRSGFIWIGTENGLYRYDGYRFYHYLNLPGDTTSINSNVVFKIYYDSHNNLWIGTFMGLSRYDEKLDIFYDFNLYSLYRNGSPVPINGITEDKRGTVIVASDIGVAYINPVTYNYHLVLSESPECKYSGTNVTTYHVDTEGNHWLATNNGVFRIDSTNKNIRHYDLRNFSSENFTTTWVHRIYQDSKKNVWIAAREQGVFMKKANADRFTQYTYQEENRNSLGSNETYDIYEDHEGQIWISTNGGGLNLYREKYDDFLRVKHTGSETNSLLNNNVRTIFEDKQGNLWIASFQAGINIYINHPQLFRYYQLYSDQQTDYQSNIVCSVYQYDRDRLWVGTDGGGLKLLNRKTNSAVTYLPDKDIPGSFPDKVVMTIYRDRSGTFWFGSYQGGLAKYDEKRNRFYSYQNDPGNENSINSNFITSILEDRKGNFWIGTNGGGLNLFDRKKEKFRAYLHQADNPNSLIDDFVNDIIEDHSGNIWVATFWGMSKFNTSDFRFTHYLSDKTRNNTLSHNSVFCLFEDSKNRIWAGSRNGLNLYRPETQDFIFYTEKDDLAGNIIYGILEDDDGFLWISTNRGLTKFDPETAACINFSESDGLQSNEFFRNSVFKGIDGELFFGGINGCNSFFPREVKQREYLPTLVITGFRIFDQEVAIGRLQDGRTLLKQSIDNTTSLKLRYSDKIFSFHVAAIDFITPENIVYAYRMEGFDEDWNYTNTQYPVITYTNLNPGEYNLLIKAGNQNIIDQINNYRSLRIRIVPPVWKTWWAYIIYMSVILGLVYYFWQLSLQRIREKEMIRMEILKREKAEELNQAKLRFFTNISHEFRTPLTLIIGPLEQILKKGRETNTFRHQLDIMLKNARRMLRLVNQLLDFRKYEGGKMTLKTEYTDLISFIHDISHSFEDYANEKSINFKFIHSDEKFDMWFDTDKVDKILFNLLSNAFKFTPEKGSITLKVETGIKAKDNNPRISDYVKISISDTGSGIPEKDIHNLFERFYQADNKQFHHKGSGLGLSLTKNMVEIHGGKIEVETSTNGTTFTILLPAVDSYLTEEQKFKPVSPGINKYLHLSPEGYHRSTRQINRSDSMEPIHNKPNVLLVEDDLDLRTYLEQEFHAIYNLYNASDGMEGYELAVEILPDLIISDIMMPEMNGYEFCKKIKSNLITSHIPVILLTAKTSTDDEIEGFEAGADAYIGKPFEIDHLIAKANAIIENRMRLREKFNAGRVLANFPTRNTADDKFIQKVRDSVNKNIAEIDFGVLELSKDLGISRVHLHRKLKAIANVSPNEFIKNIRLQRASEILLTQEFTISEVCYKVGFNSPAYFSSCFKTFYRMSPSEFVEKNRIA